jgi:hypothetical protein
MSAVALVIPPVAVIIANRASAVDRRLSRGIHTNPPDPLTLPGCCPFIRLRRAGTPALRSGAPRARPIARSCARKLAPPRGLRLREVRCARWRSLRVAASALAIPRGTHQSPGKIRCPRSR